MSFLAGFFRNIIDDMNLNLSMRSITAVNITDIIDILLIALLTYTIIVWIKETRAWSLFKGVAVLVGISIISYFFQLHTILWLVQNAFAVGLIAVIVLFQPELRKALEQLGRGKIVSSFISSGEGLRVSERTLTEVFRAVAELSKDKTGAIIVIEQDVALGDHEATGVAIDAEISSQLLENIFVNKAPLHDGAVIIRNNRIAAAACILPLTETELSHDLGTRHRASLGTSEVSDAIVIVVSEESGKISAAKNGKLYRNLTIHEAREMFSAKEGSQKRRSKLNKRRESDKDAV